MPAQYTLYIGSKNWSSWSMRPWLVLKAAKVAFEEVVIPLRSAGTKASIAQRSPSGKVPALTIKERGKDLQIWDSLAICETIAERFPRAKLWPKAPAARAEARSVCAEMHSGFQGMRSQMSMEITGKYPTPALDEQAAADVARVIAIWSGLLARKAKGGFLFGPFSIADAFYAPVVTRFETYSIEVPKPVRAYMKRVLALPAMKEWAKAAKKEAAAISPSA